MARVATVSLPIENNDKPLNLTQDIRGFVEVGKGASASLFVHAIGKMHVIDLANLKKEEDGDLFVRLDAVVPPKTGYVITLFLLAERNGDDENATILVQIDSLDVEFGKPKPQKKSG